MYVTLYCGCKDFQLKFLSTHINTHTQTTKKDAECGRHKIDTLCIWLLFQLRVCGCGSEIR